MCGICGIVDLTGGGINPDRLLNIRESLTHRGPDEAGLHVEAFAGLGHRRLSIIDLSPNARQPLQNEDGNITLVCNGEIYNYRELRQRLVDTGHKFKSNSDNEVLIHAYEHWGLERTVAQVKGMFAFAIWDRNKKTLWLARDRLGVKPLFYAEHEGAFLFSSEVQALYPHLNVSEETVNRGALDCFLAFGYIPPDRCLVEGIHKLAPGQILRYDSSGIKLWKYWDVEFSNRTSFSFPDQLDEVDQLLTSAVTRRLESDVPLGSFLSAGIDSGLVTAIAAQHMSKPLRTFTVAFEGGTERDDERDHPRLLAERYGTRHEELIVSERDKSVLPEIIWNGGEPFFDIGILPFYQIAREARKEITVALTGDGGDESFCGYYNVYAAYIGSIIRQRLPATVRRMLATKLCAPSGQQRLPRVLQRLGTALRYANSATIELYDNPDWWTTEMRTTLFNPAFRKSRPEEAPLQIVTDLLGNVGNSDSVEEIIYTDLHLRLPGDYLTKADIASNAVALEVRSPFLDHELVEFAATLPPSSKMWRWQQKGLLRKLAQKYLPKESVNRRNTGFGPPLGNWLRGDWAHLVDEFVGNGIAKRPGIFNAPFIGQITDEHIRGRKDHTQRLWSLVCLEIWWRMFIDGSMGRKDSL